MTSAERSPTATRGGFAATRWSVVLQAQRDDSARSTEALDELCRAYWPPLYAFLRRNGDSPQDAQDFTQAFFAALLEKKFLRSVDPARGKFRSFLLAALKHFVANERDKARALKRGGAIRFEPLSFDDAETRYCATASEQLSPDRIFERAWSLTLLDRVLSRLEADYSSSGKSELYSALKETVLGGTKSESYGLIAARLGVSEGALKVAAHRLRQRYRELLREEILNTVADPKEVEAEMRHLFASIAS